MDISEDNVTVRRSYKCKQHVLDNLNIAYNSNTSMIILWNKYQIFVYEKLNFNEVIKTIVPSFQIDCLLISNHYLACLDTNGKIHLDTLNFKNTSPKLLKTVPKLEEDSNLAIAHYGTDHTILCLKFDTGKLKLCFHQFDAEFKILKHIIIIYDTDLSLRTKRKAIILKSFVLSENKRNIITNIKNIFNVIEDMEDTTYSLVIVSFDRRIIYSCMISLKTKNEETQLKKLYSCPSEISNIKVLDEDDLYLFIALTSGTIIKLSLTDNTKKAYIVHLNTAINNTLVFNDNMLYTDGLTMWKSKNTFSNGIKLTRSIITQIKDFIKLNDQIICTTFTKLIYVFQVDDKEIFLNTNSEEYCSASIILNNSHYLQRIIDEIDKNNVLVKKINQEENHILTLSLSNRPDIMDKIINTNIIVYENYEDVIQENSSVTLTERINTYFEENTLCMLTKIAINSLDHIFEQILYGVIIFHITFMSDNKIIKTSSIKLVEQMKKINYLIPLKTQSCRRIKAFVILATKIPGTYDEKQVVWNALYKKEIFLNSEHFIKTGEINKNVILMKSEESSSDLIVNTAVNQYGNTFQFTKINKNVFGKNDLAFYVKLPSNYKEILRSDSYCKNNFSLRRTAYLSQQYSSADFVNSKSNLLLLIGYDKVIVQIIDDSFSSPVLKVYSKNVIVGFDIRNLFANILYDGLQGYKVGEEYINHTFYTVVENNQKALRNSIKTSNIEEIEKQIANFERNVVGNLPI